MQLSESNSIRIVRVRFGQSKAGRRSRSSRISQRDVSRLIFWRKAKHFPNQLFKSFLAHAGRPPTIAPTSGNGPISTLNGLQSTLVDQSIETDRLDDVEPVPIKRRLI